MARVLVLTSRLPYPPREGHQLRTWHLLRAIASAHTVSLLSFVRNDDLPEDCVPLRSIAQRLELFPIPSEASRAALASSLLKSLVSNEAFVAAKYASPALRARVSELATECDLIHVDMLPLMGNVRVDAHQVPLVLNAHNVEYQLLVQRVNFETRPARRAFLRSQTGKLLKYEAAACLRADAVLACSQADAAQIERLAPGTPITVVPNGVDLDFNRPATLPPARQRQIVFVGQMGWFPNLDGVEWFLAEVFPTILEKCPDTEFLLIGKIGALVVPDAVSTHVRIVGFVPDLRPLVHDAAVYVVPLRTGSGTRLKVLEAMALGKAIVTTSIGSEGIALRDGEEARFADTPATFAHAVVHLLENPETAQRLGKAARALAVRDYGWDAIGESMLSVYSGLLEGSQSPDEARREARQR